MDAFKVRLVNARPIKGCVLKLWVPNVRKYPPEIGMPHSYCETHGHKWNGGTGDCPTWRWVKDNYYAIDTPPDFLTQRFMVTR